MSSSSVPPLVVSGLGRRHGTRLAVADLTFRVEAGETVGLLGANGAGKSTTLRMLAGCLLPSAGTATISGVDLLHRRARAHVGYAPETPPLDPDLSPRELIRYAARLRGADPTKADDALHAVDLAADADRRIASLSGGMRRRLGVALALVHRPKLLLLDEPAAGLDPDQRDHMKQLVRAQAASGAAVLLSTHLLDDAEALCDRVLVLREGRLVTAESTGHVVHIVLATPADVVALLGHLPATLGGEGTRWTVRSNNDLRPQIAAALAPHGLIELRQQSAAEVQYRAEP